MTQIKAIGFDYSGVLGGYLPGDSSYTEAVCNILDIDIERYRNVYFSINHLVNTGIIGSWHEFAPILLKKLDRLNKLEAFTKFSDEMDTGQDQVDGKMLALVDKLRVSGLKVGLLSNNTREVAQKLRKQGLHNHFDAFLISSELGLQKPDLAIFRLFADQLHVAPQDLVFIDDSQKSLSTSIEVGFTPIHFISYDQLLKDLSVLHLI